MTQSTPYARSRSLALAAMAACAASCGAAHSAQAAGTTNLGPPNYTSYCQKLGFVGASFTLGANGQWTCQRPDGTSAPINLKAACEFSYPNRPIEAVELIPGAIFTWQCQQISGSSGGSSGNSWLDALTPTGRGAKIGTLLRKGAYPARFRVFTPGTFLIYWYLVPRGAHIAKAKPILAAAGRTSFVKAGTPGITVRLNRRGRSLLAHAKRLKLTSKGIFTPAGSAPVQALRQFTLKR